MQYRTMKSTGDKLSALGYGCMRFPKKGRGLDADLAIKQLRYAIDHGVNYLDTAYLYMGSEAIIGKALADGYREKVKLATKLPPFVGITRADMDKILDIQLRNLQTDHIDYYLLHGITFGDWKLLKEQGVEDFIAKAKADGRIRNIGFSTHCVTAEFKQIIDDYDWDFCQMQYNILDENRQVGKAGLQYAAAKGLGVVIMEPLRGGSLVKEPPAEVQAIWDEADVKRSPAEWGLRWVWNHPEVTVVLSGMNEEKHIVENLRVAGEALPNSLSPKEISLINKARDAYRKRMKVGCTGCNYCMPCPSGVNIPGCFEKYNSKYMGHSPMQAKIEYMVNFGGGADGKSPKAYASRCISCGKCVKKCTQQIDIPKELNNARKELETTDMKVMRAVMTPAMKAFMRFNMWSAGRKARAK